MAVALRRPSDMGYADDGYDLPDLGIKPHLLPVTSSRKVFATDLRESGTSEGPPRDPRGAECARQPNRRRGTR